MPKKGKYEEWLLPDGLLRIEGWARDGLIEKQICQNMGINERTLSTWKERFPAIKSALKKGKEPVDLQVENALLKRALGYEVEETVTDIEETPDGKKKKHIRKVTKHIPGDTTAQIFWLKNRRPDKWRDKVEIKEESDLNEPIMELLKRLDGESGV